MRLPRGESATVEIEKLTAYCLNPAHPRGRHKARVFFSALGISAADAEFLRHALLDAAASAEAFPGPHDRFGARYTVDLQVKLRKRTATVRSHWIVRRGENEPRFVTCYVV